MALFQTNNRMLLISNDSFIIGLLTGYCVANHFILEGLSSSSLLKSSELNKKFKLIIIDLRQMEPPLLEVNLELLKQVCDKHQVRAIAIHDDSKDPSGLTLPWIDRYIDKPFITNLDEYFNERFIDHCLLNNDRRLHNRRGVPDRRIKDCTKKPIISKSYSDSDIRIDEYTNYYVLGPFKVDRNCRTVLFKGQDLELTVKEYNLFCLLAENLERVYTADEIIKHLWPQTNRATKSDLYQYMHLLRKKVEQNPDDPRWILTIKGVGYKLHVTNH